jgi:hypothetical protein
MSLYDRCGTADSLYAVEYDSKVLSVIILIEHNRIHLIDEEPMMNNLISLWYGIKANIDRVII